MQRRWQGRYDAERQPRRITEFVAGTGGNVLAQSWQTNNPELRLPAEHPVGRAQADAVPGPVAHFEYWTAKTGANASSCSTPATILCH